jgi:hypothetical protein
MTRLAGLSRAGRLLLAVAVGGATFGIASAVQASIPDASGVIHGCYNPNGARATNGTGLNIIDSAGAACGKSMQAITWGQHGPTGARGPTGAKGAKGTSGAKGTTGATGATGPAGTSAVMFAQVDPIDTDTINQQSGGITWNGVVNVDQPFSGYSDTVITFPKDVSSCVVVATNEADNNDTVGFGGLDDHVLTTSINANGTDVTVYRPTTSGGYFPPFGITAVC